MKYIVDNFASIEHLLKSNETRKQNEVFESTKDSESDDIDFTLTSSYQEAADLMRWGYEKPLEEIKKGVEAGIKGLSKQKTSVKHDVVGFAPCVPNAILGLPKSMINAETVARKQKIITIVYDTGANAMTSTQTFINAGIAVLTIINSLESSGYRVSLKATVYDSSVRGGDEFLFATVMLKDWRQPLDLKKMAFPFCHPSMLRRIGFKWIETQPELTEEGFRSGYGRSNANHYSYEELTGILRGNKLIAENEKYINIPLCYEKCYNAQEIAKACGLEI